MWIRNFFMYEPYLYRYKVQILKASLEPLEVSTFFVLIKKNWSTQQPAIFLYSCSKRKYDFYVMN